MTTMISPIGPPRATLPVLSWDDLSGFSTRADLEDYLRGQGIGPAAREEVIRATAPTRHARRLALLHDAAKAAVAPHVTTLQVPAAVACLALIELHHGAIRPGSTRPAWMFGTASRHSGGQDDQYVRSLLSSLAGGRVVAPTVRPLHRGVTAVPAGDVLPVRGLGRDALSRIGVLGWAQELVAEGLRRSLGGSPTRGTEDVAFAAGLPAEEWAAAVEALAG